ncbi:MAG: DUF2680 domain-containing protein [Bacillota bacterium]|nr:DUF2680 domain-containing protein [Bacillota bacterium]
MNLKKGLVTTSVILAVAVPTTIFAATSTSTTAIKIRGLFGIDGSKLTTSQQADVKEYAQKMADLQKSLLDKMVSNGSMTKAQADAQKAQIDSNLANGEISIDGRNGHDGMRGGIDDSKLTDDQKKNLLSLEKEDLSLKNDLAKILVDQKLITQAQADTIKENVDAAIAALSTSTSAHDMMRDGAGSFGMLRGVTLTDTQKTAILGWATKSADVQKKIVALYKDAGAITQTQADAMNAQINVKAADPLSFAMMGNGRMGGGGKMDGGRMDGGRMGGRHGH